MVSQGIPNIPLSLKEQLHVSKDLFIIAPCSSEICQKKNPEKRKAEKQIDLDRAPQKLSMANKVP